MANNKKDPKISNETEKFSVVQFFRDHTYEYVRKEVDVKEAAEAAQHYCTSVAARLGVTEKVMIIDSQDNPVFLWTSKAGISFPTGTGNGHERAANAKAKEAQTEGRR